MPDGYPTIASRQLEHDQLFINDPAKQLVVELRAACYPNTNPCAEPNSSDTKADASTSRVHFLWAVFSSAGFVYQWWSVYECYCIGPIPVP